MSTPDKVQVEVTDQGSGVFRAVVKDTDRNRAWSGQGPDASTATTEAVRGFLGDRRSTEYVGKST